MFELCSSLLRSPSRGQVDIVLVGALICSSELLIVVIFSVDMESCYIVFIEKV